MINNSSKYFLMFYLFLSCNSNAFKETLKFDNLSEARLVVRCHCIPDSFPEIDSITLEINTTMVEKLLTGVKITSCRLDDLPLFGDGLGYHALLKFKMQDTIRTVYIYREYDKNCYLHYNDKLFYKLTLRHKGRSQLDKLIKCNHSNE